MRTFLLVFWPLQERSSFMGLKCFTYKNFHYSRCKTQEAHRSCNANGSRQADTSPLVPTRRHSCSCSTSVGRTERWSSRSAAVRRKSAESPEMSSGCPLSANVLAGWHGKNTPYSRAASVRIKPESLGGKVGGSAMQLRRNFLGADRFIHARGSGVSVTVRPAVFNCAGGSGIV